MEGGKLAIHKNGKRMLISKLDYIAKNVTSFREV